jgi:hypothetical protein
MRKGLPGSLVVLLAGAGWALGQGPPPGNLVPVPDPHPAWAAEDGHVSPWVGPAEDGGCKTRVWASADYLMWWVKNGPLPPSFVLTGDPNTDNPGALNAGGHPFPTGTLIDYGTLDGVRVLLGGWLDSEGRLGVEGGGFVLPQQTKTFRVASDATGNPVLGFRYQDPPDPVTGIAAEDVFQASIPAGNPFGLGPFAGSLAIVSQTRLWGAEVNAVAGLASGGGLRLQALGGFRYADLSENLGLQLRSTAVDPAEVTFLGNAFPAPSTVATTDSFQTRNQFYGGQLGLRGEYTLGRLVVGSTAKVALGSTHEVVNVLGTSTLIPNVGPAVTVPSGQFAGPSNIGRRTGDEFAVIPEVEVKLGFQVTDWLRATVGYDFLYWSRVVRPGKQVDIVVDDRLNAVNGAFDPTTTQVSFPRPEFNKSDFWAQGLTFGVELRY